jgi:multimeric flavodoxin WrbA
MKLVALQSSARKGGNTETAVRLVEDGLRRLSEAENFPLEFEYIALSEQNIGLCRGCRACFDRGEEKCPLKDGLLGIGRKLLDADGAIFASPVYVEDVTAVMKNFIDRMAWSCHRPAFPGKTALILTTSGSGSSNHAVRTLRFALGSWGYHIAGSKKLRMGALTEKSAAAAKYGGTADKLASLLAGSVLEQKALKPSFFSLMMFKIQQTAYRDSPAFRDTYDRGWWEKSGRLEKGRTFYIPHRASPVKVVFARALGAVMAKVFV